MRRFPSAAALAAAVLLAAAPAGATMPPAPGVRPTEEQKARLERFVRAPVERGLAARAERARKAREAEARGEKAAGPKAVSGSVSVPVLAVKYSNTGANPYPVSDLQNELFVSWPTGTMKQYYAEISYGALTVGGTVYNWIAAPQTDAYYEGSAGCNGLDSFCGAKTGQLLLSTLQANDGAVNFGQYDDDGPDGVPNSGDDDGYVDFVAFVHPEIGGECGNDNLWSHRWVLSGWGGGQYATNDAKAGGGFIKVEDYVIQPARGCGGGMIEIGVFCHEFGHAFGLPDLYDTDGSSEGVGEWELMASGSYGGDGAQPQKPSHMSAWSKAFLGWVSPTSVTSSQTGISVPRAETSAFALKIPFAPPVSTQEYFLVENRQKTGFDASLRQAGLLVWHVDDAKKTLIGPNTANNQECIDNPGSCGSAHSLLALEQADGNFDLEHGNNRSDAGDPWRGGFKTTFSSATLPWSRNYGNTANAWPTLSNVSASAATMTLDATLPGIGCADADGDGYGSPASPVCANPQLDCNDANANVNPGEAEIPGNGIDDDCNAGTPGGCPPGPQVAEAADGADRGPQALADFAYYALPALAIALFARRRRS